jgi:hypothetical protein
MREELARTEGTFPAQVFPLKWYGSPGVGPRGAQVRQRGGCSLSPLASTKMLVRLSWRAFFEAPAHAPVATAGRRRPPAPRPAPPGAGSSTLSGPASGPRTAGGMTRRIRGRSTPPPARPSTTAWRTPGLGGPVSVPARAAAGPSRSNAAGARPARPLSSPRTLPPAVPAASGLRIGGGPPPGEPLPPGLAPAGATVPPAGGDFPKL